MPIRSGLLYPQPKVTSDTIRLRLAAAKGFMALAQALTDVAYPAQRLDCESLMVVIGVFIGDAEGRPMTTSKLAHFTGLPRPTVYRRLTTLEKIGKIVRKGPVYYYATDAMFPDPYDRIVKALAALRRP